jgi:SAM-dependent methyltransferase
MKKKMRFVKKKNVKETWDKEYQDPEYFSMSTKAGSEVVKFARHMRKEFGDDYFEYTQVLDVGCGNGRNLIYLAENYGAKGIGFDISQTAIKQAKDAAGNLPLKFIAQPIATRLPADDSSIDVVVDAMASHCLKEKERDEYMKELKRVTKSGGWMFIKTFLWEGDQHAKRMSEMYPGGEPYSYIHPRLGVFEHVWTEDRLINFLQRFGDIKFVYRSHGYHKMGSVPYKRRYIVCYVEKV